MNTVVYYPYFYPDPNWLKVAALCWDKVYTLVASNRPAPVSEIVELDRVLGSVLDEIRIENLAFSKEVRTRFENWIKSKLQKGEFAQWVKEDNPLNLTFNPLKLTYDSEQDRAYEFEVLLDTKIRINGFLEMLENYNLVKYERVLSEVKIPVWEERNWSRRFMEVAVSMVRIGGQLVPVEYISHPDGAQYYSLLRQASTKRDAYDIPGALACEREAEEVRSRSLVNITVSDRYVYLPVDIAHNFMTVCALQAASEGNRDLVAADRKYTDAIFYDFRALHGEVSQSVLEAYLPANLNSIEAERIAEVRNQLAGNRLKYQNEIQAICKEYEESTSEDASFRIRNGIVEIAVQRIEETKRVYRRAKLESIVSALGIAVAPPALITSIASMLGVGVFAPAGIAAAFSSLVAAKLMELDKSKSEYRSSPWSYVLGLNDALR